MEPIRKKKIMIVIFKQTMRGEKNNALDMERGKVNILNILETLQKIIQMLKLKKEQI
jgi:hypothetical protein